MPVDYGLCVWPEGACANRSLDLKVASLLDSGRSAGCNFICYPVGGVERYCWKPVIGGQGMPKPHLPDLQMPTSRWQETVIGVVSPWIDPDSREEWLSTLSLVALETELECAAYLGLSNVLVRLGHRRSPKLAAILRSWLWQKRPHFDLILLLPTSLEDYEPCVEEERAKCPTDVWSVWQEFRTECGNYPKKLKVGLELTANVDEEFYAGNHRERWRSEALIFLLLNPNAIFMIDALTVGPVLPKFHSELIDDLVRYRRQRLAISLITPIGELERGEGSLEQLVSAIRHAIEPSAAEAASQSDGMGGQFANSVQAPIRPLSSNLESSVYSTFERDSVKYTKYREAMTRALRDIRTRLKSGSDSESKRATISAVVLGAGRGPLVDALLEAHGALQTNEPSFGLDVWAVEKNRNACLSLAYLNETRWSRRVGIICDDMRKLTPEALGGACPDLVASELLGSFGDNELAPECLEGASRIIDEHTICIPQSYCNFLVPIQSIRIRQEIISAPTSQWNGEMPGEGRGGARGNAFDRLCVANLRDFCPLSSPAKCFEFGTPSKSSLTTQTSVSNERESTLAFTLDMPCEMMGFAGYFSTILYADVSLSTLPSEHTEGMFSWYPALLPMREPVRMGAESEVRITISRKCDHGGVWYEWFTDWREKIGDASEGKWSRTDVQNADGGSQYFPF